MKILLAALGTAMLAIFLAAGSARADTLNVLVGDKDSFGIGCSDSGTCPAALGSPTIDNRSVAETAATNGAQITDVYSSVFPGWGPNPSSADVLFPFAGTLVSGTLSFAGGDFQSDAFGDLAANLNGISVPFFFRRRALCHGNSLVYAYRCGDCRCQCGGQGQSALGSEYLG